MKFALIVAVTALASACASTPAPSGPQDVFMARLNALCGQRYEGRVVSTDAADANFRSQRL